MLTQNRRRRRAALAALAPESLVAPRKLADRDMARACLCGLWLAHNYLDESHRISQEIENPTGSFWHAIMHRREGDYSNSKYWFRRVGRQDVPGEGMGLAYVQMLVRRHGGEITCQSTLGVGTTFTFTIAPQRAGGEAHAG